MINNFESLDQVATFNAIKGQDLVQNLTIEDLELFFNSIHIPFEKTDKGLILPTICHNSLENMGSMKLYYYEQNHIFHCYTECSENFNLISLYQKIISINSHQISYNEAADSIKSFFKTKIFLVPNIPSQKIVDLKERYIPNTPITLTEYSSKVMEIFTRFLHPAWEKEGITQEILDLFNIKFSIHYNKIVIPHYDINHRLIGIRVRNFEKEDIKIGKYMPLMIGGRMYNHILSYNLYGIDLAEKAIRKFKRAIIFEGEKSVLLMRKFYEEDSVAVASCGNKVNKFQISLLTSLEVNEIIIAYDKEFQEINSEEFKKWKNFLINICEKYKNLANFYYLIDTLNLLSYKDSPVDKGKENFEKIYEKCKIRVT